MSIISASSCPHRSYKGVKGIQVRSIGLFVLVVCVMEDVLGWTKLVGYGFAGDQSNLSAKLVGMNTVYLEDNLRLHNHVELPHVELSSVVEVSERSHGRNILKVVLRGRAATTANIPVINIGDGSGQHPTLWENLKTYGIPDWENMMRYGLLRMLRRRQPLLTPNFPKVNYSMLERSTRIAGGTKATLDPEVYDAKIDPKEEDHSEFHKRVFPGVPNLKGEHILKLINKDVKFNKLDDEDVIWALETFYNSLHWWRKSENVIPRGVAWNNGLKFEKSSYDRLFYSENSSFNKLTPSAIEMNELWWRSSLDYFKKITPSKTVLRSATRAVDKEDVRTRAVDEDIRERAELLKTIKEQEQMIVDLQLRLLSVEEITKQLKPGPSNVDHLDQNVPVCGLDQQSMEGVSQCMNVDEPYKNWNDVSDNFPVNGLDHQPVEGVSQCTILNDEYESVAVNGLISLRSQDVGHISKNEEARDDPEFKVKENEEASHSDDPEFKVNENEEVSHFDGFLSTQQVRELINDVFDTPSLGPNSVQDDACVSKLMDVDQPSLVKNDLDDVHIDSVVIDVEKRRRRAVNIERVSKRDLTRSPTAPKRPVSVPEAVMALFRATLKEVGYLVMDPNADWAIASPYLSDMLSRFEYPLYYADGVKYGVPWFAHSLCGPPNGKETSHFWLQMREKLMFQIPLYLDNVEVFEKKNIDKENYSITFRYVDEGGLYGDCGIRVCVFLYRLLHNIPWEVDDPISFALAYRERMIEFSWKYKMLQ
ncbi:hypothetical protein Tco_0090040 [Tanacetum coccineum]